MAKDTTEGVIETRPAISPGEAFSKNVNPGDGHATAPPPGEGSPPADPPSTPTDDGWANLAPPEGDVDLDLTNQPPPAPPGDPAPQPDGSTPAPGTTEYNLGRMRESYESQMADLRRQNEELTARVTEFDVTASPEYQEKYVKPVEDLHTRIRIAVTTRFNGSDEQVQALMATPANERMQYIEDNLPGASPVLNSYFGELDRLEIEKATALENLKETGAALNQQRQQRSQTQQSERLKSIQQAAVQAHQSLTADNFLPFVKTGDPTWDGKVDQIARKGLAIAQSGDDRAITTAVMAGVAAPALSAALAAQRAYTRELEQKLGIAAKVQPGNNGGASGGTGQRKAMTPAEAYAKNVTG